MAEGEDASRTLLDAGGATDALGVLHRQTFVREVHDVDALVADRGADVAGNAFRFLGENPEAREARVDVHEGRERTEEPAPDTTRVFEVKAYAEDAAEENIDDPLVVGVGNELATRVFSFE
jgi:hypothetical protein